MAKKKMTTVISGVGHKKGGKKMSNAEIEQWTRNFTKNRGKIKDEDFTKPKQVGDRKYSFRKEYLKDIGKKGRDKKVKGTRKKAIERMVAKEMGRDPDKEMNNMFAKSRKLYGDWLGKPKKKK